MLDLKKIADDADMIVNGYAFKKENNFVRIINLYSPQNAAVLSKDGEIIETNMDDIELSILCKNYEQNKKYIEDKVYA